MEQHTAWTSLLAQIIENTTW